MSLPSVVSRRLAFGFFFVTCAGVGCGGSSSGSGSSGADTPFDLPIALSSGGPVLEAPRVQPIYLPGFAFQGEIDTFLARLSSSAYWPGVTTEYGVGTLTVLPSHVSSVAAPSSIASTDIEALFAQVMSADSAALGAPGRDTMYPLFFPATTTITQMGQAMCGAAAASGFHTEWSINGTSVAGIVIPTCPNSADDDTLRGAAVLTPTLSHELVEAATDPFTASAPAFITTDDRHFMWTVAVVGGEVADLCENESPIIITPGDIGYPVQRIWSNVAVRAGTGPCVPVPPGEIYLAGVASLPDQALVKVGSQSFSVPTLSVAAGASAAVEVTLRSAGDAQASWVVGALEYHADGGPIPAGSPVRGMNRQMVRLNVNSNGTGTGIFPLIIQSAIPPSTFHYWIGSILRR